jgi:hypothetical protein
LLLKTESCRYDSSALNSHLVSSKTQRDSLNDLAKQKAKHPKENLLALDLSRDVDRVCRNRGLPSDEAYDGWVVSGTP